MGSAQSSHATRVLARSPGPPTVYTGRELPSLRNIAMIESGGRGIHGSMRRKIGSQKVQEPDLTQTKRLRLQDAPVQPPGNHARSVEFKHSLDFETGGSGPLSTSCSSVYRRKCPSTSSSVPKSFGPHGTSTTARPPFSRAALRHCAKRCHHRRVFQHIQEDHRVKGLLRWEKWLASIAST